MKRLCVVACVVAVGLMLGGCSKCGWFWDDYRGPASCKSDFPR